MPARLRNIKRALEQLGARLEEPRRGSHWQAKHNGSMYPIPGGNGLRTEITDVYIRAMCRSLGIDEQELRRLL